MQKLIDTSTAFYSGGNSPTKKLFTVTAGVYAGRQIVVYAASPSTIKFSYADPPYTSWSTPQTVATNAADYPVSAVMDAAGNVYVVFSAQTTLNLLFRKLTFTAGDWTVGSEATIYNDKDNFFPTILKDVFGQLWVCWTCYDSGSGSYTLRHKQSVTEGTLWGSGPSDAGEALTSGSTGCYHQLVYLQPYVYCIYTDAGTKLAYRRIPEGGTNWDTEITLYTGSSLADGISVAVSEAGGLVGVAFNASGKLWYLEYDAGSWSGLHELVTDPATPPLLVFNGVSPYVLYGISVGTGQTELMYRCKSGVGFAAAVSVCPELSRFKYVVLYDANGSPDFRDLGAEAGNSTAADVYHPTSTKLIQSVGDAIYLGCDETFAACEMILSTAGDTSGAVSWAYFDGSNWTAFTPQSGDYHLDQLSKKVRLWSDSASAPSNWQKSTVANCSAFWIRITVSAAYTTAPIGTQITPLASINYLNH
jgi:hypothetical protein